MTVVLSGAHGWDRRAARRRHCPRECPRGRATERPGVPRIGEQWSAMTPRNGGHPVPVGSHGTDAGNSVTLNGSEIIMGGGCIMRMRGLGLRVVVAWRRIRLIARRDARAIHDRSVRRHGGAQLEHRRRACAGGIEAADVPDAGLRHVDTARGSGRHERDYGEPLRSGGHRTTSRSCSKAVGFDTPRPATQPADNGGRVIE